MKERNIYLIIVIFGIITFSLFNGGVNLFDWDENNFAEIAREMIVTKNYLDIQIDFNKFYEKPPLFFWLQVICMKIFGINEFGARFPNTIAGIFTLILLFRTGKRYFNKNFGIIWVLSYIGSFLPLLYFKSGIIDPWFNLFIISGIIYTINYIHSNKIKDLVISALLIGLGILTKGQVAIIIMLISLSIYILVKKFKYFPKWYDFLVFFSVVFIVGGSWFLVHIIKGDFNVVKEFLNVQLNLMTQDIATHGQPFYYHPIVLMIGVFPTSIFALAYLFSLKNYGNSTQKDFSIWMKIVFWCVLVLFSIVKTKIIHYSSMCYFGISFFATQFFWNFSGKDKKIQNWQKIIIGIIGTLYGIILFIFPFFNLLKKYFLNQDTIKDKFTLGNLEADVNWSILQSFLGVIFIIALVYSLFFIKKKHKKIMILYYSTIFLCLSFLIFYVPKIEKYTQNVYLEFGENISNKDVYYKPLNMISYGYLFYSNKKESIYRENSWYLEGDIDKPVYFFSRNYDEKYILDNYKNLNKLGEKNGFIFYYRLPNNSILDIEVINFFKKN